MNDHKEKKTINITFKDMVNELRILGSTFSDKRTGKNLVYPMQDVVLGAFSVFFTQSPSFLSFQKTMEQNKGKSNAQTLFGMQ